MIQRKAQEKTPEELREVEISNLPDKKRKLLTNITDEHRCKKQSTKY